MFVTFSNLVGELRQLALHPTRRYYFIVFGLAIVLLSFTSFYRVRASSVHEHLLVSQHSYLKTPLRDAIANVFDSVLINPTREEYIDARGTHYRAGKLGTEPIWREPLHGKVLIVDIDTREPTGENQILNPDKNVHWESVEVNGPGIVTHGIFNHYLYAMIHGYDYKFFQALNIPDHHPTWILPHVLKKFLPDYQFVITMDADVVVSHLEVPIEWMMNRWGIKKHTSFALPRDIEMYEYGKPGSLDSFGVPIINTGLVIVQNTNISPEMLTAWSECTTEKRYAGCAHWKQEWSHEQRAFSEYVRHDARFNETADNIVEIPCDDAMGYPGFKEQNENEKHSFTDCNGNFFRHYSW